MKKTIIALFWICFTSAFATSSIVSKLETDTRSMKVDIGALQKKVDSFKDKLEVLNERLAIPSHIAHDLGELDKAMSDVKNVASVGKLAPPIKGQSEAVVEGVDVTQLPVHDSHVMMSKLAETIEPVREQIKKAITKIEEIQKQVNTFKAKKIDPFYKSVIDAQACVDQSVPEKLDCMQSKLDAKAKPADVIVSATDRALKGTLKEISAIESIVENLESKIKNIEILIDDINLLEHDLSALVHPFSLLRSLLQKRFSVSFPYPDVKHLFKKKHFKISLSGDKIIKGIKYIEKKIKQMIKGALYKAAKVFGLSKLAKKLFKAFDNPFKIIMKKFHLKFKVKLPGIAKLKGFDLKMKPLFKDLNLGLSKLNLKLAIPSITTCGAISKMCK
jgi:DNA repair exonuclease SbcCD ATPase subunit